MERNILAFECFGSELGKNYFENDLETDLQIEMLFDLTQILYASITDIGWQYLFDKIGMKRLYQIDEKSDWFDQEVESEWVEMIYYHSIMSGYNPLEKTLGKWDDNTNIFHSENSKTKIDWDCIRSIRLNGKII